MIILLLVAAMAAGLFLFFDGSKLFKEEGLPKPQQPAPTAPPRIIVRPGEAPRLVHGQQALVVLPGTTGCMKPAPGDSQVSFDTREGAEARKKRQVNVIKECDAGPGFLAEAPPGRYDRAPSPVYSFKVKNESTETALVIVDSW
jgi:hypothetical protein